MCDFASEESLYLSEPPMETHRQSSDIPSILVVASLPVLVLILTTLCRKPKKKCLPSPPSDPIIGHARHIPLTYSWPLFSEWFKTYGEAISVTVLGNPMVVLNSVSAAHEILDRKGANFSTRPLMFLHREWCVPIERPAFLFLMLENIGWVGRIHLSL